MKLPKIGLVKLAKIHEVTGRILNATVRRNPNGKYFVADGVEYDRIYVQVEGYSPISFRNFMMYF